MKAMLQVAASISLVICGGSAAAERSGHTPASEFKCPVTLPADTTRGYTNYRNEALATLLSADGRLVFEPGGPGIVLADGSLSMKSGWLRLRKGSLTIEGQRLDKPGLRLRTDMTGDYGETGFRPVSLIFPTPGCWEISGKLGKFRLTYIVFVEKIGDGPCSKEGQQANTVAGSLERKNVRVVLATPFDEGATVTHTHGEHAYVGGIEGSGVFDFVTYLRADGSGTFSGFERVHGTVAGVRRSFIAFHKGTIEEGITRSVWTLVDSQSSGPAAAVAHGTLTSGKDNRACYSLTTSVP